MAHEKHRKFLAETDLLEGKFDRVIDMLDSGEALPVRVRRTLANMFKGGTFEETGTELQLVIRRRDGKRGASTLGVEKLMYRVDLGRRVIELFDGRGNFDSAILKAADEFDVSERTANTAYSFVKERQEKLAESEKMQAEIQRLEAEIEKLRKDRPVKAETKTKRRGLLNGLGASKSG